MLGFEAMSMASKNPKMEIYHPDHKIWYKYGDIIDEENIRLDHLDNDNFLVRIEGTNLQSACNEISNLFLVHEVEKQDWIFKILCKYIKD